MSDNSEPNPYTAPNAAPESSDADPSELHWRRLRSIAILVMVVAGLSGISGTLAGMIRAFNSASTQPDTSPSELAEGISSPMIFVVAVAPVFVLGLATAIVATIRLAQLRR